MWKLVITIALLVLSFELTENKGGRGGGGGGGDNARSFRGGISGSRYRSSPRERKYVEKCEEMPPLSSIECSSSSKQCVICCEAILNQVKENVYDGFYLKEETPHQSLSSSSSSSWSNKCTCQLCLKHLEGFEYVPSKEKTNNI